MICLCRLLLSPAVAAVVVDNDDDGVSSDHGHGVPITVSGEGGRSTHGQTFRETGERERSVRHLSLKQENGSNLHSVMASTAWLLVRALLLKCTSTERTASKPCKPVAHAHRACTVNLSGTLSVCVHAFTQKRGFFPCSPSFPSSVLHLVLSFPQEDRARTFP